jgi:pilus assembly protein CpaC
MRRFPPVIGLLFLAAACLSPRVARTQAPAALSRSVDVYASMQADTLHLVVGHSAVLTTASPLRRAYVGNPRVLHVYSSGRREEIVTAKACGISTLILWDDAGRRRVYTIFSDLDTDGMRRVLEDAVPGAHLTLETKGDRVFLGGTVATDAAADAVGRLAAVYTKNVINGVQVAPLRTPQVQLKLRMIEVDRSRLEQYGLNFFALGGSTLANTGTQQFSSTVLPAIPSGITVSDPLNLLLYSSKLKAGVTVQDLEQKQVLQVLAEPTLTTVSGVAAKFLSGGEFPLPIVQGGTGNSTAITIVFKPYGVRVDFTPTVNPDGTIRLKVAPEVSALDYSNAVTISGFTVPALSTRRAETEVELENGQSFVLSGLLDHRATDNLSRMPGLARLPVLGELFRSKGINHSVIELLVLVTATVVPPGPGAPPVLPRMVVPNLDSRQFDQQFPGHAGASTATTALPGSAAPATAGTPTAGTPTAGPMKEQP